MEDAGKALVIVSMQRSLASSLTKFDVVESGKVVHWDGTTYG